MAEEGSDGNQSAAIVYPHDHESLEAQIHVALHNIQRSDDRLRRHWGGLRAQAASKGKVLGWSAAGLLVAMWLVLPHGAFKRSVARMPRHFGKGSWTRALWTFAGPLLFR